MNRHTALYSLAALFVLALLGGAGFLVYRWMYPPAGPITPPDIDPARARLAIPVPPVRFTDVTEAAKIRFRHHNGAGGQKFLPETMGSGVAVLDFDRDGHQDLLFVNGC